MSTTQETQTVPTEADMSAFVAAWNAHPGMGHLTVTFSQKTKFWKVTANEATIAFVDRFNGDIYKPATAIARARGVRGNILTSDVTQITNPNGQIKHLRRGRPKKNMTPDSMDD